MAVSFPDSDLCVDCGAPRVQPGRHSYKLRCLNCYNKTRYRANPEQQRRTQIKSLYGLSADDYLLMLDDQDGACAICGAAAGSTFGLAVDHDHRCCPGKKSCGGCIRGLLCDLCNRAVGMFGDSATLLQRAADYVRNGGVS